MDEWFRKMVSGVALLMLGCGVLCAQSGNIVLDRLEAQRTAFPLERVYLHTDAEDYLPGDRIWFKGYLVEAETFAPVDSTLYLYVDLFDPEGIMRNRVKVLRRQGAFAGYLDIPEDMPSGQAVIRSYSRYMENAPETAFQKSLQIGRGGSGTAPSPETDISLGLVRRGQGLALWDDSTERAYLLGLCRGRAFYLGGVGGGRKVFLPEGGLPEGQLRFLVVDRSGNILSERQFRMDKGGDARCPMPIRLDRMTVAPGEEVRLSLDAQGLRPGEVADLSVSVTALGRMRRHQPASVCDYLLFRDSGFDYTETFQGNDIPLLKGPEYSASLEGRVVGGLLDRPVPDARLSLISPQSGYMDLTRSDAHGRFIFQGLDFPEGTHYLVKSTDGKGRERFTVQVPEEVFPPFRPDGRLLYTTAWDTVPAIDDGTDFPDAILLPEAVVFSTPDGPDPVGFNRNADFSISLRQLEQEGVSCLHELLRRVPGIFIREDRCYIRAAVSIGEDIPAAIAIDGVIMDGEFDLDLIQMPDVARVDVFKTGQTAIWGPRGGAGVISITTKKGDFDASLLGSREPRYTKVVPLGYQRAAGFSDNLADRRRTLFWNPQLDGPTSTFFVGGITGLCRVVVEGVTSEGRLVHEEILFEVGYPD